MLKENVLNELNNAEGAISGQQLAKKYGVSRNAVWKAVKALQAEGYVISGAEGLGYVLVQKDVLSPAQIAADSSEYMQKYGDNACFTGFNTVCLREIDSTNTEAKRRSYQAPCTVITAEEQTAGRGRMGRSFYSPTRSGAYFSVVLSGQMEFAGAVKFTALAACAVCRAIERLTDLEPKIKWVNDVYVNDKKVCGILTEAVTDVESGLVSEVIIGVGINLTTECFPKDVTIAGSLMRSVTRSEIISAVTCEILQEMPYISQNRYIDYYRSHSLVIGRPIYFIENGVKTDAVAVGINEDGSLTVRTEDGKTVTLSSGEITLRIK